MGFSTLGNVTVQAMQWAKDSLIRHAQRRCVANPCEVPGAYLHIMALLLALAPRKHQRSLIVLFPRPPSLSRRTASA
jgi:hypothetical protein